LLLLLLLTALPMWLHRWLGGEFITPGVLLEGSGPTAVPLEVACPGRCNVKLSRARIKIKT
jgi:hypothetical protein